jgi:membrane protein YdbS with pleckstrin-like domain
VVARLIVVAILAIIGAGLWYAVDSLIGVAVAGGLIALILIRLIFVLRAIRAWGYAEREDELLVRHGLLIRRLSIVPYGRMQFVDVTAGPLDRLFRLATVQLHTAAAASDAKIPGLEPAEAARLRDRLTQLGQAKAEGL